MKKLVEMLTYKRPAGSATEQEFCERFIAPTGARQDAAGNWLLRVGSAPVLWSSHTDTVHMTGGRQSVHVDRDLGVIKLSRKSVRRGSNCLGADCTAGVWLMLGMIEDGIEGLYVFHFGEERGGIGSDYIAHETPEVLAGIEYAIAFDRHGAGSVVTHQGWLGGQCCSQGFAVELAARLGPPYRPDPTGVFTDTANYTECVSECTNISVGYYGEHSTREMLDYKHLFALREAMREVDVPSIGARRIPGPPVLDLYGYEYAVDKERELSITQIARILKQCLSNLDGLSQDDVEFWVERNPDEASELLAQLGF